MTFFVRISLRSKVVSIQMEVNVRMWLTCFAEAEECMYMFACVSLSSVCRDNVMSYCLLKTPKKLRAGLSKSLVGQHLP